MSKISFITFLLASFLLLGLGFYIKRVTQGILERGRDKEAEILTVEEVQRKRRGSSTILIDTEYSFEYIVDGRSWVGSYYQKMDQDRLVDEDAEVGDSLVIKYDPQSPKNYILKEEENQVGDRGKWFIMIGGLLLFITIFLYFTD